MAQEILCRKLEGAPEQTNKDDPARDRLTKLFDAPIPQEAMEAIEDLIKAISLDNRKNAQSAKAGKKAVA
jgi:hypothetical protein